MATEDVTKLSTDSKATPTVAAPASPAESAPTEFPLTLEEFCIRLSITCKRVELIGAFSVMEAQAGNTKDLESAFMARFDAFAKRPI